MRRRQEAANNDVNDGITILESPDLSADEKKHGPRRRNCHRYRLFILFRVLKIIVMILLFNQSSLNFIGVGQPTASSRITDSATSDKNNIPAQTKASKPPKIPRRLIFTYKYNLIAPRESDPPFDAEDPLTKNVLHTIVKYQKYWEDMDFADGLHGKNETEKLVVSFLSDDKCLEVITESDPRLVKHFNEEKRGEFKADICRVAELNLYGGYYFDIDIGVVEPVKFEALDIPPVQPKPLLQLRRLKKKQVDAPSETDIITFSSVFNQQGRFFQAFTAAMPRHPVLKKSLDYMVDYYEGTLEQILPQFIIDSHRKQNHIIASRKKPGGMGVGPYTLSLAYRATTDEEWEEFARATMKNHGYVLEESENKEIPAKRRYARYLYEISLEDKKLKTLGFFQDVPLQDAEYKRKVHCCNYVCFGGNTVYFYSRVPGSKGCPLEKK